MPKVGLFLYKEVEKIARSAEVSIV